MTVLDPSERVLDDTKILATAGSATQSVVSVPARKALFNQAVPTSGQGPGAAGAFGPGVEVAAGSYVPSSSLDPNAIVSTKPRYYSIRLGRERKHPVPRWRFNTLNQARAEAAAATNTSVITNEPGRGYQVFETDKRQMFIPPNPANWRAKLSPHVVSVHDQQHPGQSYASAVAAMKAASGNMLKALAIQSILIRFFQFDSAKLHTVSADDYTPGKLNIDPALGDHGLARFTNATGQNASPRFGRNSMLPGAAFAISEHAFDPRTRLITWRVILHEEYHVRLIGKAISLWGAWQASSAPATFFSWLGLRHRGGSLADDRWLMIREAGRDLTYAAPGGTRVQDLHLSEALAAFTGFSGVYHNLPLARFRKSSGSLVGTAVFAPLQSAEEHWYAAAWDQEVKGLSARIVRRWATYIAALSTTYQQAVKAYLQTRTVGAKDGFHPALRKALGW